MHKHLLPFPMRVRSLILFLWNQHYSLATIFKLKGLEWLNYNDQTLLWNQSIHQSNLSKMKALMKWLSCGEQYRKKPFSLCFKKGIQVSGVQNTRKRHYSFVWKIEQFGSGSTLAYLRWVHVAKTYFKFLEGQGIHENPKASSKWVQVSLWKFCIQSQTLKDNRCNFTFWN